MMMICFFGLEGERELGNLSQCWERCVVFF